MNRLVQVSQTLRTLLSPLVVAAGFTVLSVSCSDLQVIDPLDGVSQTLLNQDSVRVDFPDDFGGEIVVAGFIYTHCPDICPAITANMSNVNRSLKKSEGVRFVGITFDPLRDTPSVLKEYMRQFNLDEERFTFLTGDTASVDSLLDALNIYAEVSYTKTTEEGRELYFINHTNRITLLDRSGRIRAEYNGSHSKPEHIVEDINKLR
ncbi:MAG: SCO family protein [Balneolaceae bacterium]|nr:SCO family protein [Balneolaceae bacterium]